MIISMEPKLCVAPSCGKIAVDYHCEEHHRAFKPKYLRYKQLQSQLPRTNNLDKLNVEQLMKLYNSYARVYKLRYTCMRKYFDMKHWDIGLSLIHI